MAVLTFSGDTAAEVAFGEVEVQDFFDAAIEVEVDGSEAFGDVLVNGTFADEEAAGGVANGSFGFEDIFGFGEGSRSDTFFHGCRFL